MRWSQNDDAPPFITAVTVVFLGVLLALLAHDGIVELRIRYELWKVEQAVQKSMRDSEMRLQMQRDERQRQQYESAERERANRSALELSQRLERERMQRRELAWSRYFQPTPGCKADPSSLVCANEHASARKRFDEHYVDR